MENESNMILSSQERNEILQLNRKLRTNIEGKLPSKDFHFVKESIIKTISDGGIKRDCFGFFPVILDLQTAYIV